jgi:hypothetical protein
MYKLYCKRVIGGVHCEPMVGEFPTLDAAARWLYGAYWLDAYCIGDDGQRYNVDESDYYDEEVEADCVRLSWSLA